MERRLGKLEADKLSFEFAIAGKARHADPWACSQHGYRVPSQELKSSVWPNLYLPCLLQRHSRITTRGRSGQVPKRPVTSRILFFQRIFSAQDEGRDYLGPFGEGR